MEIVLAQFHKKSTVIFQMLEPEHRVVCLSYHTDTKYTEQLTYYCFHETKNIKYLRLKMDIEQKIACIAASEQRTCIMTS